MADRAVKFHRAMAPYEPGDIAGFVPAYAEKLVARGIADFHPPVATPAPAPVIDILTDMDRAALLAFGKTHLGMADEPPAGVTDDALRTAIRASVDAELLKEPAPPVAPAAPTPAAPPPATKPSATTKPGK